MAKVFTTNVKEKEMKSLSDPNLDLELNVPTSFDTEDEVSANAEKEEIEAKDMVPLDSAYGWVVVFFSFLVCNFTSGMPNSFGVFLYYYSQQFPTTSTSYAALTFVGSSAPALGVLFAAFTGRAADKFGYQICIITGSLVMGLGLILASFATEIWHLILTQGILVGIGVAIAFPGAVSAPAQWFHRHLGLATGVAISGSGVGGLVLAPVSQVLIDKIGIQWTLRCLGIATIVTLTLSSFFIKKHPLYQSKFQTQLTNPDGTKKKDNIRYWFDFSKFKDYKFQLLCFGGIFCSLGNLMPYYLLQKYAVHVGLDKTQGSTLIGIVNGGSAVGRILFGSLSDKVGKLNILAFSVLFMAITNLFIWNFSYDFPSLIVFAITFGLVGGGYISLIPAVTAQLFGKTNLATVNGLVYFCNGIPLLVGAPIGLAILTGGGDNTNYLGAILYSGLTAFVSFLGLLVLRVTQQRKVWAKV